MSTTVDVKMEVLEGLRGDFTVYHVKDFLYKLIKTHNARKYFNCIIKSCNASYIVNQETNIANLLRPHNHLADKTMVEHYKFLTILRQRARTENIASRALFAECQLGFSPETVKRIGDFEKHKKIIYKARNSSLLFGTKEKKACVKVVKPEFTILDGLRSDTKVYLCNGFLYFFRKTFNNKNYHACIAKTCPAKLTYDCDTRDAVITRAHNHVSDSVSVEYHKFLTKLRCRSREEMDSPKELFAECLQELSDEAVAMVGSYKKYRNIMQFARQNPLKMSLDVDDSAEAQEEHWVPDTLWELYNAINRPSTYKSHSLKLKQLRRVFLRFYEELPQPQIIFVSFPVKNSLEYISKADGGLDLHIDTSFNIDSKQNFHVCCLNVLHKKMVFPLIFSIMMEKSLGAFTVLLKKFIEIKGDADVNSVVTDYQNELDEALETVLPDATLKGSWFHFAKLTLTQAQTLIDPSVEDENLEKAIKMSMVLPLLPNNHYRRGVNFIKTVAPVPRAFVDFLTDYWTNSNVSTFGEDLGVHYSIEMFSIDVQRVVGADHADVWKFVQAFLNLCHVKSSAFETVKEESKQIVYRNTYKKLISEIEEEQAKFLKTQDVGSLLQNLCDCMRGLSDSKQFKEESIVECYELMEEDELEEDELKEEASTASPKTEESDYIQEEDDEDYEEIVIQVVSDDEEMPGEEL